MSTFVGFAGTAFPAAGAIGTNNLGVVCLEFVALLFAFPAFTLLVPATLFLFSL